MSGQTLIIYGLFLAASFFHFAEATSIHVTHEPTRDDITYDFPCKEANVFACIVKCSNPTCQNAIDICQRYEVTENCSYVLIKDNRGHLKRQATSEERQRLDISKYPSVWHEVGPWMHTHSLSKSEGVTNITVEALVHGNPLAESVLRNLSSDLSSRYCGAPSNRNKSAWRDKFLSSKITLVALNYHAPKTFLNSMQSWNSSGLNDLVYERIALLNDPLPQEEAIAVQFGYKVWQPKDVDPKKTVKPNVFTIGAAFYYALKYAKGDYLLFLENDFRMDWDLTKSDVQRELLGAVGMLDRGIPIVRMMSRKTQGTGTFQSCGHSGEMALRAGNVDQRRRNWYSFYCKDYPHTKPLVGDCLDNPSYRCFTSWDSNWTLNAVMVKISDIINKRYANGISIADVALQSFQAQDAFEGSMAFSLKWMTWRVPICISYDGMFFHERIEMKW